MGNPVLLKQLVEIKDLILSGRFAPPSLAVDVKAVTPKGTPALFLRAQTQDDVSRLVSYIADIAPGHPLAAALKKLDGQIPFVIDVSGQTRRLEALPVRSSPSFHA